MNAHTQLLNKGTKPIKDALNEEQKNQAYEKAHVHMFKCYTSENEMMNGHIYIYIKYGRCNNRSSMDAKKLGKTTVLKNGRISGKWFDVYGKKNVKNVNQFRNKPDIALWVKMVASFCVVMCGPLPMFNEHKKQRRNDTHTTKTTVKRCEFTYAWKLTGMWLFAS